MKFLRNTTLALLIFLSVVLIVKLMLSHTISKFEVKLHTDSLKFAKKEKAMADSINYLKQENFKLNEKNAMLINANLSLSARIRAINEYIKTGRLPSNSDLH